MKFLSLFVISFVFSLRLAMIEGLLYLEPSRRYGLHFWQTDNKTVQSVIPKEIINKPYIDLSYGILGKIKEK